MTNDTLIIERILALDPAKGGIGFVVLENDVLIDWGVRKAARRSEASHRAAVHTLISRHRPHTMVIERHLGFACRRGLKGRQELGNMVAVAQERKLKLHQYSGRQVNAVFSRWNALTKEQRADLLVERFPALSDSRPPRRKAWMSEDRNMSIFDALSFAVTHIEIEKGKQETLQAILF